MFQRCLRYAMAVLIGVSLANMSPAVAQHKTTSSYGLRKDPFHGGARMHNGTDMAAPTGAPVYATGDGVVLRSRNAGGYGLLVEIAHGHGYVTRYAHLSKLLVPEGAIVMRGQMVGRVGSTGRSTGPHLHYEVRINGKSVEPSRYMQIVFAQPVNLAELSASLRKGAPRSVPAAPAAPSAPRRDVVVASAANDQRQRVRGSISIDNYFEGDAAEEPAESGFAAGHVRGGAPR